MSFLIAILAMALLSIGLLILAGREKVIRIHFFESNSSQVVTGPERLVVGCIFAFVGIVLGLAAYSAIVLGDPYWLLDKVFGSLAGDSYFKTIGLH